MALAKKQGIYINLDRSQGRKSALEQQLLNGGLDPSRYLRLSAIEPSGSEPQMSRGLERKGDLGLWKSMIAALGQIAYGDFDDVVHVLEDDASFSAAIVPGIARISEAMLSRTYLKDADIVFLDYFITPELFAHILAERRRLAPTARQFVAARGAYLACSGCFLIRRSSAAYLATLLSRILEFGSKLAPMDITLRHLLKLGAINGYLTVPPLAAPAWDQDEQSTIQTQAVSEQDRYIRRTQRSYLLLRLLAAGLHSPFWCAERLAELHGVNNPLSAGAGDHEFLPFFESLQSRMAGF